jgi:hypothetical protein
MALFKKFKGKCYDFVLSASCNLVGVCWGIILIYFPSRYFIGTKSFPSNEPQIQNVVIVGNKHPYEGRFLLAKS